MTANNKLYAPHKFILVLNLSRGWNPQRLPSPTSVRIAVVWRGRLSTERRPSMRGVAPHCNPTPRIACRHSAKPTALSWGVTRKGCLTFLRDRHGVRVRIISKTWLASSVDPFFVLTLYSCVVSNFLLQFGLHASAWASDPLLLARAAASFT